MVMEMQKCRSEFVYLDLTSLDSERVKKRVPKIYSTCLQYNIDVTEDLVPVRPAAHYAIGGVLTDLQGATTLKGLYAAGEVAATGVHGANRLASNSLLEGLVFGARAAAAMANQHTPRARASRTTNSEQAVTSHASDGFSRMPIAEPAEVDKLVNDVRCQLWTKVGIIREGRELSNALERLESIRLPCAPPARWYQEARNMLEVALLITRCALEREESRGTHYRADFPLKNNATRPQHSFISTGSPVNFAAE